MSGGLLVIGDVITDVVARHEGPLAPATDTPARIAMLPGGAGANAACWAVRRGARDVRMLGRVGADAAAWHGQALIRAGVRPLLITDQYEPTGTVVSLVDSAANGERTFLTDSGAALRLSVADWRDGLLNGVSHLHLSGYLCFAEEPRALVRLAMAAARARRVPVSVDPASAGFVARMGVERFLATVKGADVLLPNRDEALLLTGADDPVRAAEALGSRFPLVVVTLGAEGALVAGGGAEVVKVSGVRVTPRDTTGAGDAFTGGFLAARLGGAGVVAAAEAGCRAGAEAVTLIGGRPAQYG
ncbi:carbohydrate kinase family protein [Streptomyces sp. GC420]|uniref:carbohydrate kinase family protein n=1 Tax=Streptomyces sp. GC420 TaxID=2697568 RepID=UPI0014152F1D|nr:PfkB family carbohydrate kinase [Streptomyces sp. GC420]NBM18286.1 sugar kinase [Streptomyces sp. GC420]